MDAEKSSVDSNYKIDGVETSQVSNLSFSLSLSPWKLNSLSVPCPFTQRPPKQVQIIGCIREMTTKSTNITWMVEDGTGIIEVKMWIDEEDSEFQADKRSRWKYVRKRCPLLHM